MQNVSKKDTPYATVATAIVAFTFLSWDEQRNDDDVSLEEFLKTSISNAVTARCIAQCGVMTTDDDVAAVAYSCGVIYNDKNSPNR